MGVEVAVGRWVGVLTFSSSASSTVSGMNSVWHEGASPLPYGPAPALG